MIKIRKILGVFILMPVSLFSQVVPNQPDIEIARMQFQANQVIPPSPEAAELGKYGNIPVSLFTGTPNVSIPLMELKGSSLSLPVSFNYSSTGFKPQDIAPWTGLGWVLSAGGVITRSVLGEPDMDDNYFISPSPLKPVPTDEYEKQLYFLSIRDKGIEVQPDVYYYNFVGRSGKFYVYPDGQIMKKEKNELKITRYNGSQGKIVYTIEDGDGTRYHFTELERTTIVPLDDQPNAPPMVVRTFTSAWYLSEIRTPPAYGNEVIDFEYYSPEQPQSTISNTIENNSATFKLSESSDPYWEFQNVGAAIYVFHPPSVSIYKKFLKKIRFKKSDVIISYIDFESIVNQRQDLGDANFDGERLLKKIKLYNIINGTPNLTKEFDLGFEYFGISQTEVPKNYRRLKLKTIQEISPEPAITPSKPPYTFYYHNEYSNMPERWTSGLDHWGYYNGENNTYGGRPNLIPTVEVIAPYIGGERGLGANREANAQEAMLTVLEKISFPTGGFTSFKYEGNEGEGVGIPASSDLVGGIRLKEMTDYSFPDKRAVTKVYDYKSTDGSSSGHISARPHYYSTTHYVDASFCPPDPPTPVDPHVVLFIGYYSATISASSIFGLGTIQGSHVGYTRVVEKSIDLSNHQSLGETVYTYNIEGYSEIDDFIGNGDLIKQETFDNSGKLLEEVSYLYHYETFNENHVINRRLQALSDQTSRTQLARSATHNDYLYYSVPRCYPLIEDYSPLMKVPSQNMLIENYVAQQRKLLVKQTRKVFDRDGGTYLLTSKIFTYLNPEHNNPTLTEEVNSKGEKIFTSVRYAADYIIECSPQSGSTAWEISGMTSRNIKGYPIEKLQYRENDDGSDRRYISGVYTEYRSGMPQDVYYLKTSPIISNIMNSEASCDVNNPQIDPRYYYAAKTVYDVNRNIIEVYKTDDITTSYLWGYGKTLPVAQVIGKSYDQVIQTGISQTVLDNPVNDSYMRIELDKLNTLEGALVTTYTYKPGAGITSKREPTGLLSTYQYDLLNRLTAIRDNDGNITRHFSYNYGTETTVTSPPQTLFYSHNRSGTFTKSCPAGMKILPQFYSVPYGKYISSVSQAEADQPADAEYDVNGQALADRQTCKYYNVEKRITKTPDNCGIGRIGLPVKYIVTADTYSSTVSQSDADAMAMEDINTNAQAYANLNGSCVTSVTINCTIEINSGVVVKYTNDATGDVFTVHPLFGISTANIPTGNYTVEITVVPPGYYFFSLGCMSYIGNSPATFYNVNVAANSCNSLIVGNYN